MADRTQGDVTTLLRQVNAGHRDAFGQLMALIYPRLRVLARSHFRRERAEHVLQPTALVNEAYLRMVSHDDHNWQNRTHFLGAASQLMRRILVDHARAHAAGKRGHGERPISLDDALVLTDMPNVDLLALDQVLSRLAALDPQQSRVVELRFFGGLTMEETAEVLDISPATVGREWTLARAWLYAELRRFTP
jgi:RNA polymerase sigma-70 factor (ECF subfamily)